MAKWFGWVNDKKLHAAAVYTANGGRLLQEDARAILLMLDVEGEEHIRKNIGNANYNEFFPTNRHGAAWNHGHNPQGVIDHYTAGIAARGTLLWFSNQPRESESTSSAHVIIDRNGVIISVIPSGMIAWHARGDNGTHYGIEHVNAGLLGKSDDGYVYQGTRVYPKDRVDDVQKVAGERWEPYTGLQIISNIVLKRWLMQAFPTIREEELVDHQAVAPTRKRDCGPMWPLKNINEIACSWESLRPLSFLTEDVVTLETLRLLDLQHRANSATA